MKLNHNTILITGGSSGIGLELARTLLQKKNTVIVCGRSEEKLIAARQKLPSLIIHQCDISREPERRRLCTWISQNYPGCNILINNAAIVNKTDFRSDEHMIEKTYAEIETNLIAPISLTKLFLPVLEKNKDAAIINITTGLVFAPRTIYPIYNATKAGLHSFTKVLREQLKNTPVKVIEVMMPAIDTPWHNSNPPKIAIPVELAVADMLRYLELDKQEIKIGKVKLLSIISRIAPGFAFKKINSL